MLYGEKDGMSFDPDNFFDELENDLAEGFVEKVSKAIREFAAEFRCSVHNKEAEILFEGENLQIKVNGCCKDFEASVKEAIKERFFPQG